MNACVFIPGRWREKMLSGQKLAVILPEKCADRGDVIEAFGARFHVVGVMRTTLDIVSLLFYGWDGCSSADEFRQLWTQDHPDLGYRPKHIVSVHVIKRIEDASR